MGTFILDYMLIKRINKKSLKKSINLFDIFAICTGTMFSTGLFLLPGLAVIKTGPSMVFAYLVASVLILPALYSKAELSTAMPKAGGTFYFLDKCFGPLIGTIGGLGIFFALLLKTAFSLMGIGLYLLLLFDISFKPLIGILIILFTVINILGSKQSTTFQGYFVNFLVIVFTVFLVDSFIFLYNLGFSELIKLRFSTMLPNGLNGFFSCVGFVFVSYAGLTKISSVAEEVQNPDTNIPKGMLISLIFTTSYYVLGAFVLILMIPVSHLSNDITVIATASTFLFKWMGFKTGLYLMVFTAIVSFALTCNAGILSCSRYPLAMAQSNLLPPFFAKLSRFQTPSNSILFTSSIIFIVVMFFDVEGIAKLASAFQLLIFILVHLSLIVMRESKLETYDPGYSTPFYPWVQLFGVFSSFCIIIFMGIVPVLFTALLVLVCLIWYLLYVKNRVKNYGAVFHLFARLGYLKSRVIYDDLWQVMRTRGLRESDDMERLIAQSTVIDIPKIESYEDLVNEVATVYDESFHFNKDLFISRTLKRMKTGMVPIFRGVSFPGLWLSGVPSSSLIMVRIKNGLKVSTLDVEGMKSMNYTIYSFFFLLTSKKESKQHLRYMAELVDRVDRPHFIERWFQAQNLQGIRELMLDSKNFINLILSKETTAADLIGNRISEINFPLNSTVSLIKRKDKSIIPSSDFKFNEDDSLLITGTHQAIDELKIRFGL